MDKQNLRKTILNLRDGLTKEETAAKSRAVVERLKSLELGDNIMVYLAFANECSVDDYIISLLAQGKKVFVPYCHGKGVMDASRLLDMEKDLETGYFGIRAPKKEALRVAAPETLDAVIVPGVGFDRAGNRLGFGGGYYDRFLPKTRPDCKKIAVCFDLQLRDDLQAEEHDFPMAYIITEKGTYHCSE